MLRAREFAEEKRRSDNFFPTIGTYIYLLLLTHVATRRRVEIRSEGSASRKWDTARSGYSPAVRRAAPEEDHPSGPQQRD